MEFTCLVYIFLCFPALKYPFVKTQNSTSFEFSYSNCTIHATDSGVRDKIELLLEDGNKIIFIHLSFPNQHNLFSDEYVGRLYKPMDWVRTTGRHSIRRLLLPPEFEQLSLSSLSFDIEYVDVALRQEPERCTSFFNTTTLEEKLRELLLSDFETAEQGSLSKHEHICNMHIHNDHSYASFFYQCCHMDTDSDIVCQDMIDDFWIDVVFVCIAIINILTLMFFPLLIPTSLYRKKYETDVYEHTLSKALKLRLVKTDQAPLSDNNRNNVVLSSNFKHMKKFYEFINKLEPNKIVEVTTNKINIVVQYRRLVPENYDPASITDTFVKMFLKCRIRNVPVFRGCCNGSIWGNCFKREKSAAYASSDVENGNATDSKTKSSDDTTACTSSDAAKIEYASDRKTTFFGKTTASILSDATENQNATERKTKSFDKPVAFISFDVENKHATDSKTRCSDKLRKILDSKKCQWYRFLKICMSFLMLLTVSLPWIFRVVFFYVYERPHDVERQQAAAKRNLTLPSFQKNFTKSLTPLHGLFIVCYIIFVFDTLLLGFVSHHYKIELQKLMRKCLRDMREISRMQALEWSVHMVLIPFEKIGICGILIFAFYILFTLPVIILVIAFYYLPTVNITLRIGAHLVAYLVHYGKACFSKSVCMQCKYIFSSIKDFFHLEMLSEMESLERPDTITIKNRIFALFVSLLTLLSFALLATETITFFMEVFVYTIIGIIMNASSMLKYISLIFMLALYARDCFKGISDKYVKFNNSINQLVVDMMRKKGELTAENGPKNTAFQVGTEIDDDIIADINKDAENVKLIVRNAIPKWHIRRLILFLDTIDKSYLTEKFFFRMCYMDAPGVPGPLIPNLASATLRFICICVFLMFVFIVVTAFGDEYKISGTNQLLATLAGGFLPLVLKTVLFETKDSLALDTENVCFKRNFKKEINDYKQIWDISDIEVNESNNKTEPASVIHHDEIHDDNIHRNEMETLAVHTSNKDPEVNESNNETEPPSVVHHDEIRDDNISLNEMKAVAVDTSNLDTEEEDVYSTDLDLVIYVDNSS